MIKLLGAVLIIAGTAAWGIRSVVRLTSRTRSFSALIGAIGILRSEICDRLTPTSEVFALLADKAGYPADMLFKNALCLLSEIGDRPFSGIWSAAVENTAELLLLPEEEQELKRLGLFLGRYNVEEQRTALERLESSLGEMARRAQAQRETNSRMHAFLGVAAGIFAVVILI